MGTTLTAVVFTAGSVAFQHIRMGNVDKQTAWVTGGASGIDAGVVQTLVAAGARVVSAFDQMLDTIINRMGTGQTWSGSGSETLCTT